MTAPAAAPTAAFVAPFVAFLMLTSVEAKLPAAAWPWAYAAKIAVVAGILWRFRRAYPAPRWHGVPAAFAFGIACCGGWVALARIDLWAHAPEFLRAWLAPARAGFDPAKLADPLGRWLFVAVRLLGLALVVPLLEEVFWRGFLVRWFIDERFETVPEGAWNWPGFAATAGLFVAVHSELLAALAWALAAHWVWVRGRNLWANIAFHAGTNAALGAWILATRDWRLW